MSPLWDMTVTVYREGRRQVVEGCFYTGRITGREDICGIRGRSKFTLYTPPESDLRLGDKVVPGVGPDTAPAQAEGITWLQPLYLGGTLHHYEAGN